MWCDLDVTRYIGGKPFSREEVWSKILRYAGHWSLLGFGYWVIADRESGRFLGEAGFADFKRQIEPSFTDLPEIGWALASEAQGAGIATEAVGAVAAWVLLGALLCACSSSATARRPRRPKTGPRTSTRSRSRR